MGNCGIAMQMLIAPSSGVPAEKNKRRKMGNNLHLGKLRIEGNEDESWANSRILPRNITENKRIKKV